MIKSMTILYKVGNNLYINLTNRCPYACTFCLRNSKDSMADNNDTLWLEREPEVEEVKLEFSKFNMDEFKEVVFCGYGEPTERLYDLLEIAKYIKETYNMPIRINTNGTANLIWEKDVTQDLEGLIDTLSISLNTPNAEKYHKLVRSRFGDKSYEAMLNFAEKAKKYVPNIVMTTVETTITKEEEKQCQEICDKMGVKYRIRPWED